MPPRRGVRQPHRPIVSQVRSVQYGAQESSYNVTYFSILNTYLRTQFDVRVHRPTYHSQQYTIGKVCSLQIVLARLTYLSGPSSASEVFQWGHLHFPAIIFFCITWLVLHCDPRYLVRRKMRVERSLFQHCPLQCQGW